MAYDLTYEVEDIGEWFGAEFAATVTFTADLLWIGAWRIEVEAIDLYEMTGIPTRGDDDVVRTRWIKERREVPAWLWQIIARNYRDAMEHVAQNAHDDARYQADDYADYRRDELISREMRG